MAYYYSGNVRKHYVSPLVLQRQLKIKAQRRAQRLEHIKNITLVLILIGCFLMAAHIDQQSLAEGLLH